MTQINALADANVSEVIWNPYSWQYKLNRYMPAYLKQDMDPVIEKLTAESGLVSYQDIKRLRYSISTVHKTDAFVLQVGNPDEQLKNTGVEWARQQTEVLNTLSKYLEFASNRPVLPIGIIGGNYARMTKQPFEQTGDHHTFSFYGDMVNQYSPSLWERRPNANRLIWCYEAAKNTLSNVAQYAAESFVSHLGAHLYYEQAQVRKDEQTQTYFAASAHMLWLEASHLYADSSYLEFCRGIINPIGIRLNTELTVEQVVEACQQLNPDREQGKLVLMSGITAPSEWLEELILVIKDARQPVLWLYDPLTSNDTSCVVNSAKNSRELKAVMTVHDKLESRLHGLFLPCANSFTTTHQNGSRESLPILSFEQALQLCSHFVYSDLNRR